MTVEDFIWYVLVPHTAHLLVQEDHPELDANGVWDLMDESRAYGLAHFLEDLMESEEEEEEAEE